MKIYDVNLYAAGERIGSTFQVMAVDMASAMRSIVDSDRLVSACDEIDIALRPEVLTSPGWDKP